MKKILIMFLLSALSSVLLVNVAGCGVPVTSGEVTVTPTIKPLPSSDATAPSTEPTLQPDDTAEPSTEPPPPTETTTLSNEPTAPSDDKTAPVTEPEPTESTLPLLDTAPHGPTETAYFALG